MSMILRFALVFLFCPLTGLAEPTPAMRAALQTFRRDGQRIKPRGECERFLLDASEILGRPMTSAEIADSLDEILAEVGEQLVPDPAPVARPTPAPRRPPGPYCFTGPMRVRTLAGERAIADLREGDVVWSYDLTSGREIPNTIRVVTVTPAQEFGRLEDLARPIEVTARHRFLSGAGRGEIDFTAIADLKAGDNLFRRAHDTPEVPGLTPVPRGHYRPRCGTAVVFELLLIGEPHNYFIEGVLVHNGGKVYL